MTKDIEKGIGELLGYETPETKARRVKVIRDIIKASVPKADPLDLYTPLEIPKETPKATPKKKEVGAMQKHKGAMRWITRPPDKLSKEEKKEVVKDFYKPKPMPIVKYIDTMNRLYGSDTNEKTINQLSALKNFGKNPLAAAPGADAKQMEGLKERLAQSRAMTGDPKHRPHLMWNGKEHIDINDPNYMKDNPKPESTKDRIKKEVK